MQFPSDETSGHYRCIFYQSATRCRMIIAARSSRTFTITTCAAPQKYAISNERTNTTRRTTVTGWTCLVSLRLCLLDIILTFSLPCYYTENSQARFVVRNGRFHDRAALIVSETQCPLHTLFLPRLNINYTSLSLLKNDANCRRYTLHYYPNYIFILIGNAHLCYTL